MNSPLIPHRIANQAQKYPDRIAVKFFASHSPSGKVLFTDYTFSQIHTQSDILAQNLLGLGLQKGMKALFFLRPSLEFTLMTFACMKIGVVPVFIDPGMGLQNVLEAIEKTKPEVLCAVPLIHHLRRFFPKAFASLRYFLSAEKIFWNRALSIQRLLEKPLKNLALPEILPEEEAAVVFTSGGTGKPKGVVYYHKQFAAQLEALEEMLEVKEGDMDLASLPLFSLLNMAMGVRSVLGVIDPRRPAASNISLIVHTIQQLKIDTASGSPSVWEKVANYCVKHKETLPSLRSLMLFGAPVRGELLEKFSPLMPQGRICTPYGATECLPVSMISHHEVLASTHSLTQTGHGTCIGRAVGSARIEVIPSTTEEVSFPFKTLAPFEVGEIVVKSPCATAKYNGEEKATRLAKIFEASGEFWHRMGDLGYLDDTGRLWFCGRKVHQVQLPEKTYYPIPCEGVINQHKEVRRSALIGLQRTGGKEMERPALVLERIDGKVRLSAREKTAFKEELQKLAKSSPVTAHIADFYLVKEMPVDIRHQIKIDRLQLQKHFNLRRQEAL